MRFFQCLTSQELELLGSPVPDWAKDAPHTPIALLTGKMAAEECDTWRQQVGFLEGCNGAYFGRVGWARISIEPLELDPNKMTYGETIQDPQLLILEYKKGGAIILQEFPFVRQA